MFLAAGLIAGLSSCQDEVLVQTKDETKANELLAAIAAADEQLATLSVENNTLTISNVKAQKLIDKYEALRQDLLNPYSEPTEVHYTVTVLSSSNAAVSSGRTKGFEGATVVVEQNGLVLQPSSASGGLYLFTGLKEGYVYVRLSAPDHTSVEYRAYLYLNNGQDVASAKSFNAQTQVVLFPISGPLAAKYTGKAYANTTVLNDTLNRKYGSGGAFGVKANTFIAPPMYNLSNENTYVWDGISPFNVYGNYIPGSKYASYENALAGHKIHAYPNVAQMANNDYTNSGNGNGKIYNIVYKGLVTSTTVGADGTYTLPVISYSQDGDLAYDIRIESENYVAPHTRFTTWGGDYYGQENEPGSVEVDIRYYNNTNGTVTPFNGVGTSTVSIPSATAATIKRRIITEDWWYYLSSGSVTINDVPVAGETRNLNLYFQPRQRN